MVRLGGGSARRGAPLALSPTGLPAEGMAMRKLILDVLAVNTVLGVAVLAAPWLGRATHKILFTMSSSPRIRSVRGELHRILLVELPAAAIRIG